MPAKPSWILQLPTILRTLEALDTPVVDRACFERVFGIRRRRAIQLMHQFGGYQAGRTFLVDRKKLIGDLRKRSRGDEYGWELERRKKLVSEIEMMKRLLPGRKVRLMVPPEVVDNKMANLPAGIHLSPTELRIEYHGTEDLLRHLFELSQAIMNDYARFSDVCESGGRTV
jgi:hypothetical protein